MALSKYVGMPWEDTAVGYYRIINPARFLKREGIVEESRTLPWSGMNQTQRMVWKDKTYMEMADKADVIHTTLMWKQADILKMLDLRHWSGAKLIVDCDDNIYTPSEDNPASQSSGLLQKNRQLSMMVADGVTVSVPYLKDLYAPLNKNIFVQKNGIDFSIWDNLSVQPHKKIRIGWRGSYGHREDVRLVIPALREIVKRYPNIELVSFGYNPAPLDTELSWENTSWVGFQKYPETLAKLNLDIAIVPLVDSSYNRCKSNINWLENSALKIPVVYSPTENHRGLPGFAASTNHEWFEALSTLIEDGRLRRTLGKGQYAHAKEHFDMKTNVQEFAMWAGKLKRRDLEPL